MAALLPFTLILVCPIVMGLMMFFMGRGEIGGKKNESRPDSRPQSQPDSRPQSQPDSRPQSQPDSRPQSQPQHDPRAPQNLVPIGALEKRLRHEMGDSVWLRRTIEDYLYDEYQKEAAP